MAIFPKCLVSLLVVVSTTTTTTSAFLVTPTTTVITTTRNARKSLTTLPAARDDKAATAAGVARFFGVWAAAAIVLTNPWEATATAPVTPTTTIPYSSIALSDAIKTLDMSLPTYSDIVDSKASASNVPSLTVPPSQGGGSGVSRSSKKKGFPVSSVLPSMGKKSAKAKAAEKTSTGSSAGGSIGYKF